MSTELIIVILVAIALAFAAFEEWTARGKSALGWAVICLAVAAIIGTGIIKL